MNVDMMKLVDGVKAAKNLMTEEPEMVRGWVLKRSGKEDYIIFGEDTVTITPHKHKASFYEDYAQAIAQGKLRGSDLDLRLCVAERVKEKTTRLPQ